MTKATFVKNLLNFFHRAGRLKDIERSGWKLYRVKKPESVADHSWRTALMAMLFAKRLGLNENRAIKMALVHDLTEAITGDYMPNEISRTEKRRKERAALRALGKKLGRDGSELLPLWEEFEFEKSREGKLVREIDRLEMALQAVEYENGKRALNLQGFLDSVEHLLTIKQLQDMFGEVKAMRKKKTTLA